MCPVLEHLLNFLRGFFSPHKTLTPPPKPAAPAQVPVPTPAPPPPVPAAQKAGKAAAWLTICVVMVAGFEGLYTHPYRDIVGVKTVCYGETAADGVDLNRDYTKQECMDLLQKSLPKYDAELRKCIHVAMAPQVEAAVVSLGYNVGTAAVCRGSVAAALNRGDVRTACNNFMLYDRAGGRVVQGLVNRRTQERALCLKGLS